MAQWIRFLIQIVSLIVLSQLLSPTSFGLVTMVTAVIGVAAIVGDFGLSLAALTGTAPDQNQRSKLFIANASIGFVLAAVVAASAPAVSALYGRHELTGIALGLAPVFLFNALAVQFKVEMNLRHAWMRLAASETAGPLVGLVVAITVATIWQTYWALVLQQLVASCVQFSLAVVLSEWRPSRPNTSSRVKSHLRFGRDTFALQGFNYVTSNLDSVLIGHQIGAASLGEYSRAYQLAMTPVAQIAAPLTRALLPRLSIESDRNRFNMELTRIQRVLAWILLAPLSLLIGAATPITDVFLGPGWTQVPALLEILSLGAVCVALGYIYYWAFLARRATGTFALTEGVSRVLMIAAMIAVIGEGSIWVATAVAVGQLLLLIGSSVVARRRLGVDTYSLLIASVPPVMSYLVAAAAAFSCSRLTGSEGPAQLAVSLCSWFLGGAFVVLLTPAVRRSLREMRRA